MVKRVPWSDVYQALKLLRLPVAHTVKPDECQRPGQRVCAGLSVQLPLCIGLGLDGEAGQGLAHGGGVGSAQFGYAGGFAEVGRGQGAQRGGQQQVVAGQCRHAALHVLFGQDVDHLRAHPQHAAQRLPASQRRADIDGNDHIGAQGSGHVNR